jgi:hypothetical protein
MPYVMVPVPEEHVVEKMQYVTKLIAKSSLEEWDKEAIDELFLGADEGVRSLLSVVASAALKEQDITASEAAHALELKLKDLGDIMTPLDEAAREGGRKPILEWVLGERVGPAGRPRQVRNLVMQRDVAEMVRAIELEARKFEPHPLDRTAG